MLISDDYYETLNRPNVEVVTTGIDHVEEDGIVLRDGRRRPSTRSSWRRASTRRRSGADGDPGVGGRRSTTSGAATRARPLGLVASFPNFFMMYGPNTNLGHNSIIFMIECQTEYVMDCLRQMDARDLGTIAPKPAVLDAYNAELQRDLAGTAWAATSNSWYKTADGTITNNWSGTTFRYWLKTRRADLACYDVTPHVRAARVENAQASAA